MQESSPARSAQPAAETEIADSELAHTEVPVNRAARRGKARGQQPGSVSAHERALGDRASSTARGRRINPIRRTG